MYLLENVLKSIEILWSLGFKLVILLVIYLVPTFIGRSRNLDKKNTLTIINIFLGWTFIAWVACIAWAIWGKTSTKVVSEDFSESDRLN
jgi:uncharacterized membrane protein